METQNQGGRKKPNVIHKKILTIEDGVAMGMLAEKNRPYGFLLVLFSIMAGILAVDQWSKAWVVQEMDRNSSWPVIEDFLHITRHYNYGAAFGVLQKQKWLIVLVSVVVLSFLLYFLPKWSRKDPLQGVAAALLTGGGIGNLIDRIRFDAVVDFFQFRFFIKDFPSSIFNVADVAIVTGLGIFLWILFKRGRIAL